ncbi:dTMP kinase [Rhodococcus sp. BP-349]|uniref:dTMP kinase n=1 Tax=unclassified Rhodococcus (in: high G+C Gram-positive bacteria) TaxID=192944 RepID=UPI001C9B17EF|nr:MULTISPECIES: dTMP kinase [unclassified Rhodococcus (in: high G+C Gram-positive bacteria)]MBY6538924.1 dTMP kinase [Rhodococcus sp. BP-363]MBY6543261.1 dTMP kinase [Rhodococcus sp. BP-369]MBY6562491.1 dTMP kinase [Rhodococcus sp. BP-370]MBY6576783.1 dTMP kinase [Rhodococcus sp. BP-364]MBY6586084.1 dTMP kinase [Rhodococcus sp. BP-358]
MGTLVAIEGVDGAGKFTLSSRLTHAWEAAGVDAVRVGFPRYGESIHADLAAEALAGEHGDLAAGVNSMAVLFALDRAGAVSDLRRMLYRHDVVLLDRYVASNAAYSAARVHQDADGEMVEWVRALEFDRLVLPRPSAQILLDVPVEVAEQRARGREQEDPSRARDAYERDGGLQARTAAVYAGLAAASWMSPWFVVNGAQADGEQIDVTRLAAELLNQTAEYDGMTR